MNRKSIFTLILCFLFLFLTGCSKPIEWKEGVRSRSSDCVRTYKEWTVETSYASYAIEIEAVENQQQAEELIQKTEADLEKLREHLPGIDLNNPTVFIVIADLAEGKKVKASYASGSSVITDSDKVLSGEYLAALISSAAKINQPWLAYGIASIIRNDLPEDENLKLFYKNGGDINILGLFGARFYEEIAGEDFLYAKDTASSLVRYIQTQYGTDAIEDLILQKSTLDLSSVKADWLNHIEADVEYTYPFKNMFDSYEFSCYYTSLSNGTVSDVDSIILARAIEQNWDGSTYYLNGYSDSVSNSAKLERYLKEYYLLHDTIIDLETFDRSFYMDALSYAIAKAIGNDVSYKKINRYPQYESFVGYLVNQYSLEHVSQAVADYAIIKEVFGKSAEELFVEWERHLGL